MPSIGSTAGGTLVTMVGGGFAQEAQHLCVFNGTTSNRATMISYSELQCYSPPIPSEIVALTVLADFQTIHAQMKFEGFDAPVIRHIVPSQGASSGGTVVELYLEHALSGTFLSISLK